MEPLGMSLPKQLKLSQEESSLETSRCRPLPSHGNSSVVGKSPEMHIDLQSNKTKRERRHKSNCPKSIKLNARTHPSHCHILFILITSLIISISVRISQSALRPAASQNRFKPRYSSADFASSLSPSAQQRTINSLQSPLGGGGGKLTRESSHANSQANMTNSGQRNTMRLALIQTQLLDLRRQLEVELRVAEAQHPVTLGSACLRSTDCQKTISNSHCSSENFTCTCQPYHIQLNTTTCLPSSLLGFECQVDAQCQIKVANSVCSNGRCECAGSFVPYRKDKCLQPSKVNDYCLSDRQCQINDQHSFCKWKIPHVYGLCKCPPNYKLVEQFVNSSAAPAGLKCVPRLGDSCLNDEECLIATRDSICSESARSLAILDSSYDHIGHLLAVAVRNQRTALPLGDGWPTSVASARRCRCARGFIAMPNKLDCVREINETTQGKLATSTTTTTGAPKEHSTSVVNSSGSNHGQELSMADAGSRSSTSFLANSKHHYEMIGPTGEANVDVVEGTAWGNSKQPFAGGDKGAPTTKAPPDIQELDIKILVADETGAGHEQRAPAKHQITLKNSVESVGNNSPSTLAATSSGSSTTTTTVTTPTTTTTTTKSTSTSTTTSTTTAAPIPNNASSSFALVSDVKQLLHDVAADDVLYQNQSVPNLSVAFENDAGLRMSSLGKPCRSSRECQLRDAHSYCIEGVCECLNPTARCRANSTGCHKDTFQCRNGQCISWYFVCDRFKNCDDGSDEDECKPYLCPREAFQCKSDGICLTRGTICDGKRDCNDGSDELLCGAADHNQAGATALAADPNRMTSNGSLVLGSDSAPSLIPSMRCNPRAFTCDNGQCLPAYVFCNAVEDCADGSDESEALCDRAVWSDKRKWHQQHISDTSSTTSRRPALASFNDGSSIGHLSVPTMGTTSLFQTTHRPAKPTTTATSNLRTVGGSGGSAVGKQANLGLGPNDESPVVKTNRAAIEQLLASLSHRTPDGRGGSVGAERGQIFGRRSRLLKEHRRHNRPTMQQRRQILIQECPRDAFTCRDGKCRSSAILCSGVDGCGDNSDEDHCEVCQCQPPHN